jgi:hypothetical protein
MAHPERSLPMPHQRKHMKLTGDTHPPEVEDDRGGEEGDSAPPAAARLQEAAEHLVHLEQRAVAGAVRLAGSGAGYLAQARAQVRSRPLTAAVAAFMAGFAVAVVTRSR